MNTPEHGVSIRYIGGPTVMLSIDGVRFMTDPTFDAAGREYASGTVRLHKTHGPAVDTERLGRIDVALISHDPHPDNLDSSGQALLEDNALVLNTRAGAARLGRWTMGLDPWQSWSVRTPRGTTLSVTATPARLGPAGIEPISGDVIGFVIGRAEDGVDLLYATGDTVGGRTPFSAKIRSIAKDGDAWVLTSAQRHGDECPSAPGWAPSGARVQLPGQADLYR